MLIFIVTFLEKKETFAKILFPSFVAGIIIGKDGAEISHLMSSTGTTIKFSPGRELYPGSQDRVCMIIGFISNILDALKLIYQRILENERGSDSETVKILKMLISNISSGMVIGKSGQTIKAIQQGCGVRINITNKEESRGMPERTLTISGETTNVLEAAQMILERTVHDPESDKWKRLVSYSNYSLAVSQPSTTHTSSSVTATPLSTDYASFLQSMMQQHPAYSSMASLQQAAAVAAAATPASSFQSSPGDNSSGSSSLTHAMLTYMYAQSLMSNSAYFTRYTPVMVDGVNLTVPGATLATFEIAVPEVMVSAVLGPGAKLITDLIQTTGTRVQLSSKGDYIPGTYNRKLTISGPVLSVQSAHLMVMQNIVREQEAFRKQGLI